jgi:hypothetical protein
MGTNSSQVTFQQLGIKGRPGNTNGLPTSARKYHGRDD